MYGRGGRGSSRTNGRGRGGSKDKSSNSTTKAKERELKFSPLQYQGKTPVATYATTKDALVQYIQKTYKGGTDVAQSLEDLKTVDLGKEEPTRSISGETDAAMKLVDQAGLDIKYQEQLRRHLERKDALREGLNKAYALIYTSYCTKMMQSRIEEHPEFNLTLKNQPIAVLQAIKTLMHDPVRAQYPLTSMSDALGRLINAKQQEGESLLDWVKRFKELRDVAKSHLGNKFLDEFVEHQVEYKDGLATEDEKKEQKKEVQSKWMALLLLRGSDPNKYGSLVKGISSQFSLGNNQYPKTISAATDVLSNHKIDPKFYENQKKSRERSKKDRAANKEDGEAASFAQQKRDQTCYCCGKKGHIAPECDQRTKIPRDKWHVNSAMLNLQSVDIVDNAPDGNNNGSGEQTDDNESVSTNQSNSSANRRSATSRTAGTGPTSRQLVNWSGLQFHEKNSEKIHA